MKKSYLPALLFLLSVQVVTAQKIELLLKNSDKGLYLEHKVAAKENFFALGRIYNLHPRSISNYNKVDINKGLVIGQLLRIPLSDSNFRQSGNSGTPVYYKVGDKENLSKVSNASGNVPLENLRNWNDLANDNIKAGSKLIVGFLQSRELPSVTITPRNRKPEVAANVEDKPVETTPVQTEPVKPAIIEEAKVAKEEPKKTEAVFAKQDEKVTPSGDGYFKYHFEQQVRKSPVTKELTAAAGVFKTTSGWLDSKYYLLMDGVQPGTIIKITNPTNSKSIYAKVLGEMAGIRQNEGFDIRISSAAASALQITEQDKFILKVNY
jgi:LysM repeat protein